MSSKRSKAKFSETFSRRDNFSQRAIVILYRRAGGKCCRCAAPTFGPDTNPYKSVNIGQAAHIAAAAPGGPRYDSDMSPEQRSSATNGMWMCANCHDIIDRDVDEYPVKKLQAMKKEAEKRAKREIGVSRLSQVRLLTGLKDHYLSLYNTLYRKKITKLWSRMPYQLV